MVNCQKTFWPEEQRTENRREIENFKSKSNEICPVDSKRHKKYTLNVVQHNRKR